MESRGMGGEEYTPGHVWELLTGEIEADELDLDEMIDLGIGLSRLPQETRTFLTMIYQGHPASRAMKEAGLTGNQTRYQARAVMALTDAMNNGEEEMNGDGATNRGSEDSDNLNRAA